jgi:hypothetical protein
MALESAPYDRLLVAEKQGFSLSYVGRDIAVTIHNITTLRPTSTPIYFLHRQELDGYQIR